MAEKSARPRKPLSASQKLLRVFFISGGRGKSTSTPSVKFIDPQPDQEDAVKLAQRQLAVANFLASDRRGSSISNDLSFRASISRSNTCPNLSALGDSLPEEPSFAAVSRKNSAPIDAVQFSPPTTTCAKPLAPVLEPATSSSSIKEGRGESESEQPPPKSRGGEKSLRQMQPWNLFRANWSFGYGKEAPEDKKEQQRSSRASVMEQSDEQRLANICESPGLSSASRSRQHSRNGSTSRAYTPDPASPDSCMEASLSSLTAQTSVSGKSVRLASSDDINLNRRFECVPDHRVPAWYIRTTDDNTKPEESLIASLCSNCRRVDIEAVFRQDPIEVLPEARDMVVLGTLLNLMTRVHCGLCQLAARIIANNATYGIAAASEDPAAALEELLEETYFLTPARLFAASRNPELYIVSGSEVRDGSLPRRTMAIRPIETSNAEVQDPSGMEMAARRNRLMRTPGEVDFDWIRDKLRDCVDCDGPKEATRLRRDPEVSMRVIDVQRMCVVDLAEDDSYIALSYVPGHQETPEVQPLLLRASNEAALRHPKGLLNCWDAVPKTIQDAVRLVREIGQRHLWVDALCVMHREDGQEAEGVRATGAVFQGSLLTICACCGTGATHGLPGVEPGSRVGTRQVVEMVGRQMFGSVLRGASCEDNGAAQSKWGRYAGTLQEQALSGRRLLVTDECVTWSCRHGQVVEDESGQSCSSSSDAKSIVHALDKLAQLLDSEGTAPTSEPATLPSSNIDIYTRIVSEYTRRELPNAHEADAAVAGLLKHLEPAFKGEFLFGLPDTELSAALMWSPLGPASRRVDPTTLEPLFPSWSWLGWTGQAVYPWLVERTMPISEEPGSPLLWQNAMGACKDEHDAWFTGQDYRLNGLPHANYFELRKGLPARWCEHEKDGWTHVDGHADNDGESGAQAGSGGGRWLNPVLDAPEGGRPYRFLAGEQSRLLRFRTLSAKFTLDKRVRPRECSFGQDLAAEQTVHCIRVLDTRGFASGYVYWPEGTAMVDCPHEFVVLSRASTRSDPRIGQELLHATPLSELTKVYSMDYLVGGVQRLRPTMADDGEGMREDGRGGRIIDTMAHFDTRLYDPSTPWGLFNVMMIRWRSIVDGGTKVRVAERVAVGRIHVAAFMDAWPAEKDIILG